MSSAMAKMSRLSAVLPTVGLGLALGCAGSAYAQQAPSANGCTNQAQKTQGLPPSVSDRAQQANSEQLGQNIGQAQKTQGLPPSVTQAQKAQGLPPSVHDRAQQAAASTSGPCG